MFHAERALGKAAMFSESELRILLSPRRVEQCLFAPFVVTGVSLTVFQVLGSQKLFSCVWELVPPLIRHDVYNLLERLKPGCYGDGLAGPM